MRIGLDFDGVISDCGTLKCLAAKQLFGVDIPADEFKKELVIGAGLLTLEQYRRLQSDIYGTRELGLQAQPVPGVMDGIARLHEAGHDLRIITSRDGVTLEVAREWSALHGLTLEFTGVGYGVSKDEAARGFDVFVDDDLDKLEPLVDVVPHRFLFSWGYNRHVDEAGVAERVASWTDLLDKVEAIKAATTAKARQTA